MTITVIDKYCNTSARICPLVHVICYCLREINKAAGKQASGLLEDAEGESLSFVYPYGATLNVEKPSMAVLSSGSVSFPLNRPVCAFHHQVRVLLWNPSKWTSLNL